MKIQKAIPLFIFLFFFLFVTNARAFPLPIEYNVSASQLGDNSKGIRCVNSTIDDKIYCFIYDESGGSPAWYHKFYRYNSTLGSYSSCSLDGTYGTSYNCAVGQLALLNESYAEFECGAAYCDLWDVSNISNSTCTMVQRNTSGQCSNFITNSYSQPAVQDDNIYVSYSKNQIVDKNTFALLASGYWVTSADWGFGSKFLNQISIPDKTSNDTIFVSASGYYATASNKYPHSPFYVYQGGSYVQQIDSPATDFGICLNTTCYTDLVDNSSGSTWLFAYDRTNKRVLRGTINFSSSYSTSCALDYTYPVGTVCDLSDSSNRIYNTYDGCNLTQASCPSGSVCSQLTPQTNVSSNLVEDYVSCEIVTILGFHMRCSNVCVPESYFASVLGYDYDTPLYSTCTDPSCRHCLINHGNYTGINIQKWYTNQTSVSVPSYTIACINTTTGRAVTIIDQIGNTTNEIELLTRSGNSIVAADINGTCANTSTMCFIEGCNVVPCSNPPTDDSLTALSSWINNSFGTSFATPLISFITSACVSMYIFIKVQDKKMETFIVPFLLILGGFAYITFFPLWLLLLMTIFTGVLIFWKAKS